MEKYYLGFDAQGNIVDGTTTLRQLEDLFSSYMLNVRYYSADVSILDVWSEDPRTFGNLLINDRRQRIDEGNDVPGRPPLMVATVDGTEIVRLEWYVGEEKLELKYDLKNPKYNFSGPSYVDNKQI